MKNKNGFLLAEETLKIIIAVISIGFLVYFLTALYFTNQSSKELEQAESSLEFLIKEINGDREEVLIYNPKGWAITNWPHDVKKSRVVYDEEIKNDFPKKCLNNGWKECLCICENKINFESKDCDDNGICRESDFTVEGDVIEIVDAPLRLNVEYGDEIIITKK